jgi:hypothetical protein
MRDREVRQHESWLQFKVSSPVCHTVLYNRHLTFSHSIIKSEDQEESTQT